MYVSLRQFLPVTKCGLVGDAISSGVLEYFSEKTIRHGKFKYSISSDYPCDFIESWLDDWLSLRIAGRI